MKAVEQLERLKRMNKLIKAENTGTPNEFAQRLGISRRQLYSYIELIKDMGVLTAYSKANRTFYYCDEYELEISCTLKKISREIAKKVNGGFSNHFGVSSPQLAAS